MEASGTRWLSLLFPARGTQVEALVPWESREERGWTSLKGRIGKA